MTIVETLKARKGLTILTLVLLLGATLTGVYSVWGALFLFWGLSAIRTGQVYLVEPIHRDEDPILFWILTGMWCVFGVLYVLAEFYSGFVV